jgi:hypothetical protein
VAGAAVPTTTGGSSISFKALATGGPVSDADNATTVTLSWDPPSTSADGSELLDLAGYRVYLGNEQNLEIVQELSESGSGGRRLTQVAGLSPANACLAVTAFDTSNNEGALSEVVCKDLSTPAPAPPNANTPTITGAVQLSATGGLATVTLSWLPPSGAAPNTDVFAYSLYQGTQSQLFKVDEIAENSTAAGERSFDINNIGGDQVCFALTAKYRSGVESSLSEVFCIALDQSTPIEPGDQLRPFNVEVSAAGTNSARLAWDRPNTVVSTPDATAIDGYDIYQGSQSQLFKVAQLDESGSPVLRRELQIDNVFSGSDCFAVTAVDLSFRHSALSQIVCLDTGSHTRTPPIDGVTPGVTNLSTLESSAGNVTFSWDTPLLVAAGEPITNLVGYNLYQGSQTQLFKIVQLKQSSAGGRQQTSVANVTSDRDCFALTAYDSNGFESPLSDVSCAGVLINDSSIGPGGLVPPSAVSTVALGGSTNLTLNWVASGVAETGSLDTKVNRYNIYQGSRSQLLKVRQVKEPGGASTDRTAAFTGVGSTNNCFAITAQYLDLKESRLSDIVCRDD